MRLFFFVRKQLKLTNMTYNKKLVYEAPQVELIEVQVEQGFATSDGTKGNTPSWGETEGTW